MVLRNSWKEVRNMKKEYDTFVDTLSQLREGEEIELPIRDCETYEAIVVKAIISKSPEKLPDGDTLWIRFSRGQLSPEPWSIKIIERLGSLLEKQMQAKGVS
jgi:hypothetical protein